ncbi:hypothetical protein HMPREF9057_00079, partial [Actinomyces sp. oral taxon 171 str. F0337]
IRLRSTKIMHREAHLTGEMNRLSLFSAHQPHLHSARPVDRMIINVDPSPTFIYQPVTQQHLTLRDHRITLIPLGT